MSAASPFSSRERLPEGFQFSQSSLQDYTDCRRRFQLRYLLQFAWPAVESEPALENERFLQQGDFFHRLAYQYLVGVPADRLRMTIQDDSLRAWWENFLDFFDQSGLAAFAGLWAEISLAAPLGAFRLAAKYDLIASQGDGGFLIYDWKTSQRRPGQKWLAERLQTRLYPYLLVRAGSVLNGGRPIDPGAIEMVYWYAAFPDEPVHFPYTPARFEQDHAAISRLVEEIAALPPEQFYLTSQKKRCAYCVYRSLCGRGEQAGALDDMGETFEPEEPGAVSLDFEHIAEIEF